MSPQVKKSEMNKKLDQILENQREILAIVSHAPFIPRKEKTTDRKAPPVKERKVSKGRRPKKEKTP